IVTGRRRPAHSGSRAPTTRTASEMPSAVLIVYTNPLTPDREAAFNAWYERTPITAVLAVEGFVAASRYRLSDAQAKGTESPVHRFMSIYEVETDDLQGALDTLMRSAK